jgi:hypothetical protein
VLLLLHRLQAACPSLEPAGSRQHLSLHLLHQESNTKLQATLVQGEAGSRR